MKNNLIAPLCLALCFVFAGCQSIQRDLMLSMADEMVSLELNEIEEIIVLLDAEGADRQSLAGARRRISSLEGRIADPAFEAVLAAYSGRLSLIEGRTADAQRELRRSQNLSPQNIPSAILSFRMERDLSQRLLLVDAALQNHNSSGELLIERGRVLFDLNRFAESVAAFDSAFVILEQKPSYENAYGIFRSKAWELRSLEGAASGNTVGIASQEEITWRDLIEITRSETQLLRFITAGRDWPLESIFSQLLDRAFIPFTQSTDITEWPSARPRSGEIVLRSGAAWFLWHINAENRANRGLLTRYSSRFANIPNARSPIPDINIDSPFLDSVLGSVESEFMSLPDGRRFMPEEKVRGSDFLSMIRRLSR